MTAAHQLSLIDESPAPLPPERIVSFGEHWQLGRHLLICDDARRVDLSQYSGVVFDPPYDADASVLGLRFACRDALVFSDHRHLLDCTGRWGLPFRSVFVWDGQSSWFTRGQPLAREILLVVRRLAVQPGGCALPRSHWAPSRTAPGDQHQGSYDYTPCPNGLHLSTVFSAPASRQFRGHPHAKPTDWIRLLIGNCTSSSTILDPFAGSGTTMLACESLGRSAVLVEQSPEYCDVIVSRYRDVAGDTATVERINAR